MSVYDYDSDPCLCFAELSRMADCLPSPPEASEEEVEEGSALPSQRDCVFTFEENDARPYYNICSNVTPDSARSLPKPHTEEKDGEVQDLKQDTDPIPILQPPPGFGDSSSEDEFFDAQDRFTSPEIAGEVTTESGMEINDLPQILSLSDIDISIPEPRTDTEPESKGRDFSRHTRKKSRKRRSFMETNFTSQVSFPGRGGDTVEGDRLCCLDELPCPTVSSLSDGESEPAQLES
ncbi:hypothetical protein JZ751_016457, partial [Albula glossodonta]